MAIRVHKFTPEVLLTAPRRSTAIPNKDGTLAIYTVLTYSFQTHSKSSEICLLNLETGESKVICSDTKATEPLWLGYKNLLLYLRGGEKGVTNLFLVDADKPDVEYAQFIK